MDPLHENANVTQDTQGGNFVENNEIEMEDCQEIKTASPKCGKRRRKLTSNVWSKFEVLPLDADKKQRAKCLRCGIVYLCDSRYGTGNLKRHMASCIKQKVLDLGQLVVSHNGDGSMITRSARFDPEKFRELLVMAIVMHDLPFQFVEYVGIRNVFTYICADIKLISRNTAKTDVMSMHAREMKKLKNTLVSMPSRICLTSDLWTSIATDGYLALTAHFVDDDWKLQKRILNFSFMPPPHTGVALSDKIYKLLVDWGIEKKLFSMTLDNASANDCFVELLKGQLMLRDAILMDGEFFHVRCCAHILNLIVQEGLKEIDSSIGKIRESIKYVRGSQGRKQKFLDCVAQVSLECKRGLRQDVPTRWNSTFLMLDSAIYYQRAFLHLQLSDSNYKHALSHDEWQKVEKICKFLKVLYDVTCLFSGTCYTTSNLYFPQVFVVEDTLRKAMVDHDMFMNKMASQMITKFEKYWSEYSLILAIAVILDPRYKLQFVEFSYKRLYGSGSVEMRKVCEKLFSLFDVYMKIHSKSLDSTSSSSSSNQNATRSFRDATMVSKECIDVMKVIMLLFVISVKFNMYCSLFIYIKICTVV